MPSYFPFLWLALSGFDEAMVPKENTIFFQARFKGQGWIDRAIGAMGGWQALWVALVMVILSHSILGGALEEVKSKIALFSL